MLYYFFHEYSGQETEGHVSTITQRIEADNIHDALEEFWRRENAKDEASQAWFLATLKVNGQRVSEILKEEKKKMTKIPTPSELQAKFYQEQSTGQGAELVRKIVQAMNSGKSYLDSATSYSEEAFQWAVGQFGIKGWNLTRSYGDQRDPGEVYRWKEIQQDYSSTSQYGR